MGEARRRGSYEQRRYQSLSKSLKEVAEELVTLDHRIKTEERDIHVIRRARHLRRLQETLLKRQKT